MAKEPLPTINPIANMEAGESVREKINYLISMYPILVELLNAKADMSKPIPEPQISTTDNTTYTALEPSIETLQKGTMISINLTTTNNKNSKLTLNGGTPYPIVNVFGETNAGIIPTDRNVILYFDGTKWIMRENTALSNVIPVTYSTVTNAYSGTIPSYSLTENAIIPILIMQTNNQVEPKLSLNGTQLPFLMNGKPIRIGELKELALIFTYYKSESFYGIGGDTNANNSLLESFSRISAPQDFLSSDSEIYPNDSVQTAIEKLAKFTHEKPQSTIGKYWECAFCDDYDITDTIADVCYSGRRYIGVGNGFIAVSLDDGRTFSRVYRIANNWTSIAYFPLHDVFIAVADTGSANRIAFSKDGYHWIYCTSANFAYKSVKCLYRKGFSGNNSNNSGTWGENDLDKEVIIFEYLYNSNRVVEVYSFVATQTQLVMTKLTSITIPSDSFTVANNYTGSAYILNSSLIRRESSDGDGGDFTVTHELEIWKLTSTDSSFQVSRYEVNDRIIDHRTGINKRFSDVIRSAIVIDSEVVLLGSVCTVIIRETYNGIEASFSDVKPEQLTIQMSEIYSGDWNAGTYCNGVLAAFKATGNLRCKISTDHGHTWMAVYIPKYPWNTCATNTRNIIVFGQATYNSRFTAVKAISGIIDSIDTISGYRIDDTSSEDPYVYNTRLWSASKIREEIDLNLDAHIPITKYNAIWKGTQYECLPALPTLKNGTIINVVFDTIPSNFNPRLDSTIIKNGNREQLKPDQLIAGRVYQLLFDNDAWTILTGAPGASIFDLALTATISGNTYTVESFFTENVDDFIRPGRVLPIKFVGNCPNDPVIRIQNIPIDAKPLRYPSRTLIENDIVTGDVGYIAYTGSFWYLIGLEQKVRGMELKGFTEYPLTGTDTIITSRDTVLTGIQKLSNRFSNYLPVYPTKQNGSFYTGTTNPSNSTRINYDGYMYATRFIGAVYNDYAEYRKVDTIQFLEHSLSAKYIPGMLVTSNESGELIICRKDHASMPRVITDTYGMCIGEKTPETVPVAISGRVLIYPDPIYYKHPKVGDVVCSTKHGLIRKMNRFEQFLFPASVLGIVCEIPTYTTWGTDAIQIDGRIWVDLR